MPGIRDIKRAARQRLHDHLAVSALYIPVTGATPVPVTVRVHTKFNMASGGTPEWAERAEAEPKLIFRASELPANGLRTKAVVSVEAGEAYHIEAADPVDDAGYVRARVTRLAAAQTAGLPVPA